ncbi:hypothetical protein C8R47DRAFT_1124811 [Mycena vitilis]|nr:hypothetical protein C8R47DRAFT_1124811 [Mycena vitilis]
MPSTGSTEKRKSNGHGGKRKGAGRPRSVPEPGPAEKGRVLGQLLRQAPRSQLAPRVEPSPFFGPYNTHQPIPLGNPDTPTGRASLWATVRPSRSGVSSQPVLSSQQNVSPRGTSSSHISLNDLTQLNDQLDYIDEHDELGDIAAGDQVIDDSLLDDILDTIEANETVAEAETRQSEAATDSALHTFLLSVRKRLSMEIKKHGGPLCYARGEFFERPMHPVFALQRSLDPTRLYSRDVFVWLPSLLPGHPDRFVCTCGKPLSRNGFNDDPVARRVRAMPADFFLLTQRFICNPRRSDPGCNKSFQGTDPHIIAQLPEFVQTAFPAYISARGAVSKLMMWQMCNTFASRLGPAPFSELVSEIQHRSHAEGELMYLGASKFYQRTGGQQFSAFSDPKGYAGSPPSVPYLKALFADYMNAYRVYIERDIATLPGTILKLDHTFDFLKYICGMKGEKIFTAAYTGINEFEEVRGHSLTSSKSLAFVQDLLERIQQSLRDSNHPPTQIIYTDSPQAERPFHESINQFLLQNVQPVTDWTDLPRFERTKNIPTALISDSLIIEEKANEILADALNGISLSQLYLVAVCIKTEQRMGERPRVDIIQLRTKEGIYTFKVTALTSRSDFLPSLRAILTNSSIVKIGHSIRETLQTISDVFGLPELGQMVKARNPPILDLGKYAKLKGVLDDAAVSMHALAGIVLGKSFLVPQFSPYPWAADISSGHAEFLCAEMDCLWQIFISLRQRDSLGLPLLPIQAATNGQLVTLMQSCKPIAEGSIVGNHGGYLDAVMDAVGNTKRLTVSLTRSLIVIDKVLVPGAIHSLHGQTVEWIFNHGARAVVTTSQLHTRGQIAPTVVNAVARAFAVPASPGSFDNSAEFSLTNTQILDSTPVEFEHWSEDLLDDSGDGVDDDSESDSDYEEYAHSDELVFGLLNPNAMLNPDAMDGIEPNWALGLDDEDVSADVLMENLNQTFSLLEGSEVLPTRVLDDAFHFMDRLLRLLSKKHSAFKAFAHDFSEAIFIRDESDEAAVRAVLEQYGVDWEYAKRAKSKALNRRIRRYIPRREVLLQRLQKLFDGYADMQCSTKKSKGSSAAFFSDEAKEMVKHLLDTVRKGYLSDPPGISLYYLMGKDRDGLKIYRTTRGTNSVEGGFHMAVRRIFGSLRASPELAECLLINWILRRNKRVGFHNRTGNKYKGHFDIALRDEIVELSVAVGVKPSFPLPRVLSTRIATSETIGILPISNALAESLNITTLPRRRVVGVPHHRDTPVHLLTRLSTRTLNIYRYLQLRQAVLYAVVPVHTHQEYLSFKILINDLRFRKAGKKVHPPHEFWKNIDFTKLARSWNEMVHLQSHAVTDSNQRLYYKLPHQLEAHHKKTILWTSERATLASGSNFTARKALIAILEAPDNYANVLPALRPPEALPDGELDLSIGGSNDLLSFNTMAEPPALGEPTDSDFFEFEPGPTLAEIPSVQVAFQIPTTIVPPVVQMAPRQPRIERQVLFPGATAPVASTNKRAEKRCAPCSKAYCERRLKCNGRGKQTLCGCGHPLLARGEKLRVTEPMIRAHFARIAAEQQGQS